MIILILFQVVFGYLTYDSDKCTVFSSLTCNGGAQIPNTITFNGAFQNTPQIIITASSYILNPGDLKFTFNITDVTLTSFKVILICNSNTVKEMTFIWAAIDDRRIQVITDFVKTTQITSQSTTLKYNLDNPNLSIGFISVNSFGYSNLLDFTVSIDSIDYKEVQVTVSTLNTNLAKIYQIGFQVVLGTAEAINQSSIFDWEITSTTPYVSETLTVSSGYKLLLPVSGLNHYTHQANSISFYQNYQDNTATTGQISYTYGSTWSQYSLDRFSFREAWINTQMTTILNPFLCQKMKISRKFDANYANAPTYQLYITELTQTFDPTSGTQKFYINPETKKLNMLFTFKCKTPKKIQGQILKCKSCSESYHKINQNCYGSINLMTVAVQFNRSDNVYAVIQIEAQSSGVIITTNVYNKVVEQYTLVNSSIL